MGPKSFRQKIDFYVSFSDNGRHIHIKQLKQRFRDSQDVETSLLFEPSQGRHHEHRSAGSNIHSGEYRNKINLGENSEFCF